MGHFVPGFDFSVKSYGGLWPEQIQAKARRTGTAVLELS
jgi:hypothetical protein